MSTVDQLKVLARLRKTRLRTMLQFDRNVESPIELETTLSSGLHKFRVGASSTQFVIDFKVTGDVFFSVGQPNRNGLPMSPVTVAGTRQLPVFAEEDWHSSTRAWLRPSQYLLLRRLELQPREALHVFRNGICCVLDGARMLDDDLFSLLGSIAEAVTSEHGKDEAQSELPSASPELADFFQRFRHLAEGDDVERDELAEAMDDVSRAEFLKSATPLFQAMNDYLSSLPTPWPESASQLSDLAELASELVVHKRQ